MLSDFSLREMGRRHDELYERLLATRPASASRRGTDLPDPADLRFGHVEGVLPRSLHLPRTPPPEPTVGVIVPCYRHGIFLDDCLRSIRCQTAAAARVVVIDDGSDDPETIEALGRLEDDRDIALLRQPVNSGPSAARNRALEILDTSYVLPLDADDQLLPDALERMVAQLEAAPPDIGFIYPHAQHVGNRSDYVHSPAYNLWLLMGNNYCPAPALFDRRVFEAGIEYPEDVVFGHEDWDLVLQLAECGIHGQHADGPTFLYRRRGFSRVNVVEYGPHAFHEAIQRRHPALYRQRDRVKAHWAPALSILLVDADDLSWREADLAELAPQSCRDFEVLGTSPLATGVRVIDPNAPSPAAWLQSAVLAARGRWIGVLTPEAASALRNHSFVEKLIRSLWRNERTAGVVLGQAPGVRHPALSQLSDAERLAARPVGIAFERTWAEQESEGARYTIKLGLADSLISDLVLNLQGIGPTQWRLAPSPTFRPEVAINRRVALEARA
jgi:glycosyltransferase involved in cell wall biosynthesis